MCQKENLRIDCIVRFYFEKVIILEKNIEKYFLAANSCEGFISYFANCYDHNDGWKAYIIKGGPGTGKSSFMKYILKRGMDKGIKAELFPCSSDPDSLDAVIFPDIRTVIMDGTAPHTVDPVYPGAVDMILNFGEFWKDDKFTNKSSEIIEVTNRNKMLHKTAALYLQAAGKLLTDNLKTASAVTEKKKAVALAERICKKHLKNKGCIGKESIRFLSGVTPKGIIFFSNTVLETCKDLIIIEDSFGNVSDIIMQKIRETALCYGYDIITIKNALLPSLTDHIIIPEISLAVVRESDYQHFSIDTRRIHSRRFMDIKKLHKSREKIKFNKKAAKELLLTAAGTLKEAKEVHDELEKYYIEAMDFEKLTAFANGFAKRLL